MRCSVCGAAHDPGDRFCRSCGRRFPQNIHPAAAKQKETPTAADAVQAKKVARRLKSLALVTVAVATLLLVLAQAAPDLIKLAGFKPKDLGVTWTQEDYDRAMARCGVLVDEPPEDTDRSKYREEFLGMQQADWTFTESELTALLNGGKHAGYWPFTDIQVKLHGGNVVEVSGMVSAAKLLSYPAVARCLPQEVKSYIDSIPLELPVAAKARVTAVGQKQLDIALESLTASGISMGAYLGSDQANLILENIANELLKEAGPVVIDALETEEGTLRFQGTWYEELRRASADNET